MSPRAIALTLLLALGFAVCFLGPLFAARAFGHVPGCHSRKCDRRVHAARVTRWLWRHYKAHPLPRCTWIPESGPLSLYGEYERARYRTRNHQSSAGGKFQIMAPTWFAYGGRPNGDSYPAAAAPPLEQERIARRILAGQGIHAWVRC